MIRAIEATAMRPVTDCHFPGANVEAFQYAVRGEQAAFRKDLPGYLNT